MSCEVNGTFRRFYFHMRTGQSVWKKPTKALASEGITAQDSLNSYASATVKLDDGHYRERNPSAQGSRDVANKDYDELRMADTGKHGEDCKETDANGNRKVCKY